MGNTNRIIEYECARHGVRELILEAHERAPVRIACGQATAVGPCLVTCVTMTQCYGTSRRAA